MNEIESYLFIGGIKDGEWFNLPTHHKDYVFPVYKHSPLSMYKKDAPDTLVWEDIYQVKYIKIDLARKYRPGDKGGLFVFVSEDIYNAGQYTSDCIYDIMCKLVNNYKVIK